MLENMIYPRNVKLLHLCLFAFYFGLLPDLFGLAFRFTYLGSVGVAYEDIDDIKPPLFVALPPLTNYQPAGNFQQQSNNYQHTSVKSLPNSTLNALDKPPTYDALYAAADVINSTVPNIPSLQGVSGNNVYAVPNSDLLVSSVDVALVEFPRRNLRFVEVLGEGEFGEVSTSDYEKYLISFSNIVNGIKGTLLSLLN